MLGLTIVTNVKRGCAKYWRNPSCRPVIFSGVDK